jgi:hypothetical protein
LNKVDVNKANIEDYFDWIIHINKLNNNESANISLSIYNRSDTNYSLGISYISSKEKEKLVNVSLLEALLNKINILNTGKKYGTIQFLSPFIML